MDLSKLLPEDSFFARWLKLWPATEPPRSYILFAGMSIFGGILGRGVYLDWDVHTLYPMLNILLIGPSGIGKSTSIKMALSLLDTIPIEYQPQIINGEITPQKLHENLFAEPQAIAIASELAAFFTKQKYMEGMIPYCTRLLDYDHEVSRDTLGRDRVVVKDPSVTIIGGSTREWLQEQLPDSAATGGFLARFLVVKEDHKFQRVPNPKAALTPKQWAVLETERAQAAAEFRELVGLHRGPMTFRDPSAMDTYSLWYMCHLPETGFLAPFAARAGEFVLRLSMLIALSCKRTAISSIDIRAAIEIYNYATAKLQEVVVPLTPQGKMIANVLQTIGNASVEPQQIKRAMRNSCAAQEVDRLLSSLIDSGDVVRFEDNGTVKYRKAPSK